MKFWVKCKSCGDSIFFDVEGVTPSGTTPISRLLEEEFGPINPNSVEGAIKEYFAEKTYKEIRCFKNCSNCGSKVELQYWVPMT